MCFLSFSQEKNIKLPTGGKEIHSKLALAILDITLLKNGELYVDNSLVGLKNIGDIAYKFKMKHIELWTFVTFAMLNIDVNTPIIYVDKLETELKSAYLEYYYSTDNNKNNPPKGFGLMYRPFSYFHRTMDSEKNIQIKPYKPLSKSEQKQYQLSEYLFQHKYKKADSLRKKMSYKKIKFLSNDSILINNEKIAHINTKKIYNKIRNSHMCVIEYQSELVYIDYFKNLQSIREALTNHTVDRKENPYMLKISSDLNENLIKNNFKF